MTDNWFAFAAMSFIYISRRRPCFSTLLKTLCRFSSRLATSRPFFILDLFITLERSEKVISSDEVARASASDVSRERSTCFTCRNVNQSVNFWREKHDWHFSLFHVLRARAFHQNVYEYYSLTQINLFVYIAVCSQHYWQTAKVPLSNASWKDKTVLKPIANYFIDRQML